MQSSRRLSYLAAGVLASVTLFVFFVLQNYGPESAVRRFHSIAFTIERRLGPTQAFHPSLVRPRDLAQLAQVSVDDSPNSANNGFLLDNVIRQVAFRNGRFEIARIDYQQSNQVTVAVVYDFPDAPPGAMVWIVTLGKDGIWRVNSRLTVNTVLEMRGG